MASPFSVFRKNRTTMLVVLTLLAMFGFVVLPTLLEFIGVRGGGNNPVAVKSKYGDLTERNLASMRQQRNSVFNVLNQALQLSLLSNGMDPNMAAGYAEYLLQNMGLGPANEEATVNLWLLGHRAKELGIVIDNVAINQFLADLTQNRVKRDQLLAIIQRSGFTDRRFFDAMREVLAARQVEQTFGVSLAGLTPAQRWHYFNRVARTAKIEALPVPVDRFVDGIADPSEETLKTFFKENKDRHPMPTSPEPGFREPPKVALEYVRIDLDKLESLVTDAEIEQRYEKNKDAYDRLEKKPAAETPAEPTGSAAEPNAKPAEPTGPAMPAGEQPTTEKTDKPAEKAEQPGEEKKSNEASPKDASAVDRPSPFRLASWAEAATDEKAEEKPVETSSGAGFKPAATEEKPDVTSSGAGFKPAATEEKPDVTSGGAGFKPATTEVKPATTEVKPAATEEKPAGGLTEAIKNRIRQEIVSEKLLGIEKAFSDPLDQYRRAWSRHLAEKIRWDAKTDNEKKNAPEPVPPSRPDFEQIAREQGLTVGNTPLATQWEVQDTEIGASLVDGRSPAWQVAFEAFSPFTLKRSWATGPKNEMFLFWKEQESKDRVLKFTDPGVRDQVLRAWKLVQARGPALKAAKALAEEARQSGKPLAETFAGQADRNVVAPPPFSWITFGNVPTGSAPEAARLSTVPGVELAGEEFMKTVFGLEPGGIGAAMNAPETVAYVVRVIEFAPPTDDLWRRFEVEDFRKYAPAAQQYVRQIQQAWLDSLRKDAALQWAEGRKPDQQAESESEDR